MIDFKRKSTNKWRLVPIPTSIHSALPLEFIVFHCF